MHLEAVNVPLVSYHCSAVIYPTKSLTFLLLPKAAIFLMRDLFLTFVS